MFAFIKLLFSEKPWFFFIWGIWINSGYLNTDNIFRLKYFMDYVYVAWNKEYTIDVVWALLTYLVGILNGRENVLFSSAI